MVGIPNGKGQSRENDGENKRPLGKFKKKTKEKPKAGGKCEDKRPKNADAPKDKAKPICFYICNNDHFSKKCPLRPQNMDAMEHEEPPVGVF